jgi:hypothetical protein
LKEGKDLFSRPALIRIPAGIRHHGDRCKDSGNAATNRVKCSRDNLVAQTKNQKLHES